MYVVVVIQVSYSLLIFFCGMFITVSGFNRTGIPSWLWELMEPYSKIDRVSGIAVLAAVIIVLSNVASNVPTGISILPHCCSILLIMWPFCKLDFWILSKNLNAYESMIHKNVLVKTTTSLNCHLDCVWIGGIEFESLEKRVSPSYETNTIAFYIVILFYKYNGITE